MLIALHKNARTTPAVRAEIAASAEPASALAQRYGITEQTVYKWKKREVFGDRSHTAHRLQTQLTCAQVNWGKPNSRVTSRHFDHSRSRRVFMSRSKRPYGLTCSQISGVRAE